MAVNNNLNKQSDVIYPTTLEFIIRKLIAILIVATALLGLQFWMFFVPLGVSIGIYVFFRKRYFFFLDILVFLIGIVLYFQHLPFIGPPATTLKIFLLSPTAPLLASISLLSRIFILIAGILFIFNGVLSQLGIFIHSNKRGLAVLFIGLLVTIIIIVYPLLAPVYFVSGETTQFSHNCHPSKFAFPETKMILTKDKQANTWQYTWSATNRLNEKVTISKISATKQLKKFFGLLDIFKEERIIAPPFNQQIVVLGAKKEMSGILVEPGTDAEVKITSSEPFYGLSLIINDNWCTLAYSFLTLQASNEYTQATEEAIDNSIEFVLVSDPSVFPLKEKTTFYQGEVVYPMNSGLPENTKYSFQVIDSTGKPLVMFNKNSVCKSRGSGSEGCGRFNEKHQPFEPGTYEVQLVKLEKEKALIVAKTQVTISVQQKDEK